MSLKLNRYRLIFLTKIYLEFKYNIKLGEKLYSIYRIILIVLSVYSFIHNNPTFMLELLDNINNKYSNQLHEDSFINIKDNKFKHSSGSGGQGPSGHNGPPGPNPNPSSGNEPMYEVENSRQRGEKGKRERVEITYPSRSGEPIVLVQSSYEPAIGEYEPKKAYKGPLTGIVRNMQYYYDPIKKYRVSPEMLHFNPGWRIAGKDPIRVYSYRNITYTHDISSSDRSKHFCLVEYPDGTTCTIYDIATMAAHIAFHKLNNP
jgi:hypothetical protein